MLHKIIVDHLGLLVEAAGTPPGMSTKSPWNGVRPAPFLPPAAFNIVGCCTLILWAAGPEDNGARLRSVGRDADGGDRRVGFRSGAARGARAVDPGLDLGVANMLKYKYNYM